MPSTLLERRRQILVGDAALGSKGREVQRIKPSLALPLAAVEAELIAAADPAVAQGPLVERRRPNAVLQPSAPIANGRQGPLNEAPCPPRPTRSPAPTAVRGLRADCSHISTPDAIEPASSYPGYVRCNLMLQTRDSHPRLRDAHAVKGYLPPLHALRAFEAVARLMSFSKGTESEPIWHCQSNLSRSTKPEAGRAITLLRLHCAIR
jgi:hypothetical protein